MSACRIRDTPVLPARLNLSVVVCVGVCVLSPSLVHPLSLGKPDDRNSSLSAQPVLSRCVRIVSWTNRSSNHGLQFPWNFRFTFH